MGKIDELFRISGLNCILLKTSEHVRDGNFYYFTALDKSANFNSVLILRKGKKPLILADDLEYENMKNAKGFSISRLKSGKGLDSVLYKLPKKIGINYCTTTLSSIRKLRRAAKGKRFIDISNNLASVRETKTDFEIRKIKSACSITSEIFEYIQNIASPGMKEKDLAAKIEDAMKRSGAYPSFPPIVASGKNSSVPHHIPGNRKIFRGVLLIDIGVVFSNYCSDITRTFFVGRANEDVKDKYGVVKRAEDSAISLIRDGAKSKRIFKAANEILKKELKQNLIHSLGHGIGIDVHDFPGGISEKSDFALKEGMVLSVEPGFYGKSYGIRIEDNLVVGKNSSKLLSKSPKEIIEI